MTPRSQLAATLMTVVIAIAAGFLSAREQGASQGTAAAPPPLEKLKLPAGFHIGIFAEVFVCRESGPSPRSLGATPT